MSQLPPTSGPKDIYDWFVRRHPKPIPQWELDYLKHLLEKPYKHIKEYIVGTKITSENGEIWAIERPAGIQSYASSFKPDYTPDVIIRMGIFGGLCLNSPFISEIPIEWILFGLIDDKLRPQNSFPDQSLNFYNVIANPWPTERDKKGLHATAFFTWFVRYYLGKRSDDDDDYIKEWSLYTDYLKKIIKDNSEYHYLILKQNLLQWGSHA